MKIVDKILETALADENKKEIRGNHGWEDKEFESQMKAVGWQDGQSWCAYWIEKVWRQAYKELGTDVDGALGRLFSANAVQTYYNFWNSEFITSDEPIDGSLVLWKKDEKWKSCFCRNYTMDARTCRFSNR